MEGGLGNDISELPVAGICLDWMHEKALAIGQYFVTSGVFTIFGTKSPAAGAPEVDKFLCEGLEDIVGAKWAFEPDVDKVVKLVIDHIEKKRDALGINVKKERKLYDMADRRALDAENLKTAQAERSSGKTVYKGHGKNKSPNLLAFCPFFGVAQKVT